MSTPTQPIAITSLELLRFKAFRQYSLRLLSTNILVGPNNCGKSTIIGCFRILAAGIRRARARGPEMLELPDGMTWGYHLSEESLPVSLENVHTDYVESDSTVIFRLSNGNKLKLLFPSAGGCFLVPITEGRSIRTVANFKSAFPVTVAVVPVLGPVEHNEVRVQEETVQRHLQTHRASRHFRNFWYYSPEGFDEFASLVAATWPGMAVTRPEFNWQGRCLDMFCLENRMTRELYWSGFGFQVWCQLLTHISRARHDTVVVIDEPEIYLHPDVQRQLLSILREAGPDILLATHSTEIISEADPSELLLVDKTRRAAERLKDVQGVQSALEAIGSLQNITLTQLARTRKVFFVESMSDFQVLRRFARRLGFNELAAGNGLTAVESEGFGNWERIANAAWGIARAMGQPLSMACVFDRDFRCAEESTLILESLRRHLRLAEILQRKEIENYLLVPNVLDRVLSKAILERTRRTGEEQVVTRESAEVLLEITTPLKIEIFGQYVGKRVGFLAPKGTDRGTIASETLAELEEKWQRIVSRLELIPGKQVLAEFRGRVQKLYGVTLSTARIIDEFRREEIPSDLRNFLQALDTYRGESVEVS